MSKADLLTIHTDGAARGNPGPAAYAYVIASEGQPPIEEGGCLGQTTNNQAEYTALVRALEHAAQLGTHHHLLIHSDSELMIKQMKGEYRVKDAGLRPLYEQAQNLCDQFAGVTFRHVRREHNSRADHLCNEALDGLRSPTTIVKMPDKRAEVKEAAPDPALVCLRKAAVAWGRGNPDDPDPEAVLAELRGLLEKKRK